MPLISLLLHHLRTSSKSLQKYTQNTMTEILGIKIERPHVSTEKKNDAEPASIK